MAASMNPAPSAIRYLSSLVSRRWAPEDASRSPPARLARAASAPRRSSAGIPVIGVSGRHGHSAYENHALDCACHRGAGLYIIVVATRLSLLQKNCENP